MAVFKIKKANQE